MRRFAEDTQVPISRSRGEVDALLEAWGVSGVQWTTETGSFSLRFMWRLATVNYMARIRVALPTREDLEKDAIDGRTRKVSERKVAELMSRRGRREHRLLLLWLRAALNAVEAGMVDPRAIFLPFLEQGNGETVAEVAIPRLEKLFADGAAKVLMLPHRSL